MVKNYAILLLAVMAGVLGMRGQVTSTPSPLTADSENVIIYFHADEGNKGLANLPESTAVYAHTGVITDKSTSDTDWQYAPTWLTNTSKYKLNYVSKNLYSLTIGNMRNYYGITDPTVVIKKLAFVFRTADGSKEGKAVGDKDIFLGVLPKGFHVELSSTLPGGVVTSSTGEVKFTATATQVCDLSISVGGNQIGSASNTKTLEASYTFTAPGNYTITAIARNGDASTSDELRIVYANEGKEAQYPGGVPMPGACVQADGSVLFCLPAPEKKTVILVGSWDDYEVRTDRAMNYQVYGGQKYFWTSVRGLNLKTDQIYYYYVDGQYKVGDPYAHLVLDPGNDKYIPASVFPNLPAYPSDKVTDVPLAVFNPEREKYDWKIKDFKPASKDNLIIYELLLRDFTGTEGKANGNGTVNQVFDHIWYLRNLGVNAVELLPINEFNGNISWGYNPNFYFAPDKAYGTPEDYKRLIDSFHDHGIAVILDVVLNQSDWLHPWYQMYEVGKNPMYNASAPHAYSVLNDWNQDHELVKRQWKDMLTYWLKEYNVDGFRFDLVKGLGDNDSYANSGDAATNAYNSSRVARMRELQKIVNEVKPGAIFINENLASAKEENEMAESGQLNWANFNDKGCQYAMGYQDNSALSGMYAPFNSRNWGSTVSYLESHDEQRLAYKQNQWGQVQIKGNVAKSMQRLSASAAQMILSPGSHMIWQFSEMGNDQNNKNADGGNNTDPKLVCWSLLDDPDRAGLVRCYSELNALRLNNADLFAQDATYTAACGQADWANGRVMVSSNGNKKLITVMNPNLEGDITVSVNLSGFDASAYSILSKSYDADPSFNAQASTVTVPANTYVTIGTSEVVGVKKVAYEEDGKNIVVEDGGIYVKDGCGMLEVFTAQGMRVYRGYVVRGERVSLPAGLYIVRFGSISSKVFCR